MNADKFLTHEEAVKQFPNTRCEMVPWLKKHWDMLKPEDKYILTIDAYTYCEVFPPSLIIKLKQLRPVDYLKSLSFGSTDPITVYRASDTRPAGDFSRILRTQISWTTEKNVALFFCQRWPGHLRTLYMATIDQNKIIAYNNNRQEYEVIQHMGVKNIRPISYTEDDIKSALEWREYTDWEVTP